MIFGKHEVFGGKADHFLGFPAEELQRGGRDISLQQIRANAQYHIHAVVHHEPKVGLIYLVYRLSGRTDAEHFTKKADHRRCRRGTTDSPRALARESAAVPLIRRKSSTITH